MGAKELADWLRSAAELPWWSRSMEQNWHTPVVWTIDGKAYVMAPLSRPALYIEDQHMFHMIDRASALRFFSPQWESFERIGVVPQRPERAAYSRAATRP